MKENIHKAIVVTLITILLIGCSKEPPKCSDDNTIALVKKIIIDSGKSNELTEKEIQTIYDNIKIEHARPSAFDAKIKKYSCEAQLIAGSHKMPINYESQIGDKGQHIVSVSGFSKGDLFMVALGIADALRKSEAARSDTIPQPQQSKLEQPNQASEQNVAIAPGEGKQAVTRHGRLTIVGDLNNMQLMFNGRKLRDGDGLSLSIEKKFMTGNSDIILVMNNSGGTACPVRFFFVNIKGENDVQLSPEFGTCSDQIEVSQNEEQIILKMPDSSGKKVQYSYIKGIITEDGKPIR